MEQEKPLCVLFMDIHKMMHDRMRRQSEALGLQFGYHRIIFELAHKGLKTQNEIAAATNRSSPTVSVALQNMEKDGIVTRHQSADDQRQILVELTENSSMEVFDSGSDKSLMKVIVEMADGAVYEDIQDYGGSMHDYPTREFLLGKFWDQFNTFGKLPKAVGDKIVELAAKIETLEDLREYTQLLTLK